MNLESLNSKTCCHQVKFMPGPEARATGRPEACPTVGGRASLGVLLSVNGQMDSKHPSVQTLGPAFAARQLLHEVKPPNRRPVQPVLHPTDGVKPKPQPPGAAGLLRNLLRLLGVGTFLAAAVFYSVAVQHIIDLRHTDRLGRQLRQREAELSAAKAAYRALESFSAQQAAIASLRVEGGAAVASKPARTRAGNHS